MQIAKTTKFLAMGTLLTLSALAAPVFADDQGPRWWEPAMTKMANKDGMVTKKDFMEVMSKKFDDMDKNKKGMLSKDDIMRIFGDKH